MDLSNQKNVFPLTLVDRRHEGYFMTSAGDVYSTKQNASGIKMYGSGSYGSKNRYFTLNGLSWSGQDLLRRAKNHPSWAEHTNPKKAAATAVAPKVKDRSHATAVDEGIKSRGFVVARVAVHDGKQFLMFGSKPAIHLTEASVTDEVTRLANTNPGVEFVMLKIVKSAKSGGLSWN